VRSSDTSTEVGLRDRALIALLIYTFARISAALQMNVEDYYPQGERWWVWLHEKGGKQHEMPAHHLLESCVDAYVTLVLVAACGTAGVRCRYQVRVLAWGAVPDLEVIS
jgi:site-specific recombinase XerD